MRKRLCLSILVVAVAVIAVFPPTRIVVGSSGFHQVEFRFCFRSPDGTPLENIRMEVRDEQGSLSYGYPADNYLEEELLSSDAHGRLIFFHVSQGHEFSTQIEYVFFIFKKPTADYLGPVFYCRFFQEDREVFSIRYDTLETEFLRSDAFNPDKKLRRRVHTAEGESRELEFFVYEKSIVVWPEKK